MTQQGPKVKAKTQADSEAAKDSKTGKKEKCIALVLGGGAPNLTMMSGAVAALDDEGVEFDLISTSGAGMLIGLLYASPKDMTRQEALRSSVNMGVHDAIYNQFPVNYKVFHKPGRPSPSTIRTGRSPWRTGGAPSWERRFPDLGARCIDPGPRTLPRRPRPASRMKPTPSVSTRIWRA
jgi:predicted acylesterase/phospholipase RssA